MDCKIKVEGRHSRAQISINSQGKYVISISLFCYEEIIRIRDVAKI